MLCARTIVRNQINLKIHCFFLIHFSVHSFNANLCVNVFMTYDISDYSLVEGHCVRDWRLKRLLIHSKSIQLFTLFTIDLNLKLEREWIGWSGDLKSVNWPVQPGYTGPNSVTGFECGGQTDKWDTWTEIHSQFTIRSTWKMHGFHSWQLFLKSFFVKLLRWYAQLQWDLNEFKFKQVYCAAQAAQWLAIKNSTTSRFGCSAFLSPTLAYRSSLFMFSLHIPWMESIS